MPTQDDLLGRSPDPNPREEEMYCNPNPSYWQTMKKLLSELHTRMERRNPRVNDPYCNATLLLLRRSSLHVFFFFLKVELPLSGPGWITPTLSVGFHPWPRSVRTNLFLGSFSHFWAFVYSRQAKKGISRQ